MQTIVREVWVVRGGLFEVGCSRWVVRGGLKAREVRDWGELWVDFWTAFILLGLFSFSRPEDI